MSGPHRQELLDFQMNDSNYMKMIRMGKSLKLRFEGAKASLHDAEEAFRKLDSNVPAEYRERWLDEETRAFNQRVKDPSAMDVFQVKSKKAPTMRTIELNILSREGRSPAGLNGAATWLSQGLVIEEAIVNLKTDYRLAGPHATERQRLALARKVDRLSADIHRHLLEGSKFLKEGIQNAEDEADESAEYSGNADSDAEEDSRLPPIPSVTLPLPSSLGRSMCQEYGIAELAEQELLLQTGQANDSLHGIWLTLADKAIIFRNNIRHAAGQAATTRAWGKLKSVDENLRRYAKIYKKCWSAMVNLNADKAILDRYQELKDEDLRVSTSVLNPNGSEHRNGNLAWFWTMDIPRETEQDDWMSEFFHVNWHRAKAARDRWAEEVKLTTSEFQWTVNFFQHKADTWRAFAAGSRDNCEFGHASYASCQAIFYDRLRDQCQTLMDRAIGAGNVLEAADIDDSMLF